MFSKSNVVFLYSMTIQVFKIWYILEETDFILIRIFFKIKSYVILAQFKVPNCIWLAFHLPMEESFWNLQSVFKAVLPDKN